MSVNIAFEYTIGDPAQCISSGIKKYWVPVIQGNLKKGSKSEYSWQHDVPTANGTPLEVTRWKQYEPNGLDFEQCVDVHKLKDMENWNDELCTLLRCSVCTIPKVQTFLLRGQHEYDHEYSLSMEMQEMESKIFFEGQGLSHIIWHMSDGKTEIHKASQVVGGELRKGDIVEFDSMPFGQLINASKEQDWIFTNVTIFLT